MISRKTIETTIGKTFADKLDEIVFSSGSMEYSRREMVDKLGCANFIAAARLQKVLRRLDITTPSKLYNTEPFSLLRVRGIGETAVYVAMCILESEGYNVTTWWGWKETNILKFGAYKQHAVKQGRKRVHDIAG